MTNEKLEGALERIEKALEYADNWMLDNISRKPVENALDLIRAIREAVPDDIEPEVMLMFDATPVTDFMQGGSSGQAKVIKAAALLAAIVKKGEIK